MVEVVEAVVVVVSSQTLYTSGQGPVAGLELALYSGGAKQARDLLLFYNLIR